MKNIKNQNGVATVLMVILIGISIMTVTVVMARSYITKKESNVTGHAQVNSQLMSWAGVNAFREYILKTGESDFEAIKLLQNTDVILKNVQGQKDVRANNIKVTGCTDDVVECLVEADINAINLVSKSATTLNIIFDVILKNVSVSIPKVGGAGSFGGGLEVLGIIGAEDPGSSITLNVDGNVLFRTAARLENISNLTINASGDVEIRCIVTPGICGSGANIDINSKGKITITDTGYGTFGNLNAHGKINLSKTKANNLNTLGEVELWLKTEVKDIKAGGPVTVHTNSHAKNIESCQDVTVIGVNAEAENIKAGGDVLISIGGVAGNIIAEGKVRLKPTGIVGDGGFSGGKAKDVYSAHSVELTGSAEADNVETLGYVYVYDSTVFGNIKAKGQRNKDGYAVYLNATVLFGNTKVYKDIFTDGSVKLENNSTAENITAIGKVIIDSLGGSGSKAKDIRTNGDVEIKYATAGNIYSGNNVYINTGAKVGNIISKGSVETSGTIGLDGGDAGDIYANQVYICDYSTVKKAYAVGSASRCGAVIKRGYWDSGTNNSSAATNKINTLVTVLPVTFDASADYTPVDCDVMKQAITDTINEKTNDIKAYVSVEVYKNEANYIFTKSHGHTRVYLNKLRNLATGSEYLYENNAQYVVDVNGIKSLVSNDPLYLGKYTLNGSTYVGAVCEATSGTGNCTDEIIGYLPRISLVENPGIQGGIITRLTGLFAGIIFEGSNRDYEYVGNSSKFIISAISSSSSIDNATLAPGIMYFDDDLVIRGNGISAATGADRSAFINSFLAEGNIDAALFSPNIYSPYNALRETDESVVCDRPLKTVSNGSGPFITTPTTTSNKYLRATNLCKSANEFSHSMNRDSIDPSLLTSVTIEGNSVPKLDLGYVALMSGDTIRLMFCSQIYGDVLARGAIRTSTELICGGGDRQTVTGSMTSQTGENSNYGSDKNMIHAASKYVFAKPEYSNLDGGQEVPADPGDQLATESVTVKWARSK